MATISVANEIIMSDNLFALKDACFQVGKSSTWSQALGKVMAGLQADTIADDATAITYMGGIRKFVINSTGASVVLQYNGTSFTFANGSSYACSPNEAEFFITESTNKGTALTRTTVTEYASSGAVLFFFE